MKRFQVTVNGNTYEVEVEELSGHFTPVTSTITSVEMAATKELTAPKVVVPQKVVAPKVQSTSAQGGVKIVAPMPGKIVDVKVTVGQSVKEGDLIAILEAMKMENEIFAPSAGTIASVNLSAGAAVETNDIIVTLN